MSGSDLGTIAQAFITYFGGAAGGYMVAAAALIVGILSACHVMSPRAAWITVSLGIFAWSASYMVRNTIGWT